MKRRYLGTFLIAALLFSFSLVQAGIASSRIFLPRTDPPPSRPWVNGDPKTVELKTSDDVALTTLYWPGKSGRIIIFFHGNGGNQYYDAQYAEPLILKGDSLLIGAYRGYGGNPGKPSEQGLYSDGRAAIDFAVKAGYALNKIYLVGYSLGTGVALKLAAEYSVGGVITVAAFTDIPALAPGIVRFLISEKFDNDAAVRIRKMPLLMIHGNKDEVIPYKNGQALYADAAEPKAFVTIDDGRHQIGMKQIGSNILRSIESIDGGNGVYLDFTDRQKAFENNSILLKKDTVQSKSKKSK